MDLEVGNLKRDSKGEMCAFACAKFLQPRPQTHKNRTIWSATGQDPAGQLDTETALVLCISQHFSHLIFDSFKDHSIKKITRINVSNNNSTI